MSSETFGEVDLNSPGYEYLRSYQSMNNLYLKLVALNYRRDFCSIYKCPPIHKYYFSLPAKKPSEQVFIFTCLCAWLIKDRCQMNLDLNPEDYQDIDSTVGVVFEALKLLLLLDDEKDHQSVAKVISFTPNRLKQGFGPEVIWTINVLADRALELYIEAAPSFGRAQINFRDKQTSDSGGSPNSITVGQPIVGGGLTTRPLGNYLIDDSSLLLESSPETSDERECTETMYEGEAWYQKVERDSQALRAAQKLFDETHFDVNDWRGQISQAKVSRKSIQEFLNVSKPLLDMLASRIDRQLSTIDAKEKCLQTNLREQLDGFLKIWRVYNEQSKKNIRLMEQVSSKTDLFESYSARLKSLGSQIDTRTRELNDGTKLRELQGRVDSLELEGQDLDLKVNLLLMVYAEKRSKALAQAKLTQQAERK